jgi:hypothetical protein
MFLQGSVRQADTAAAAALMRVPAAMALAQAWRLAAGSVGAGVVAPPARTSSSVDGDAGSGVSPAPPGRVAEMAALFTCNICGMYTHARGVA